MTLNCGELALSILTAGLLYSEVHSHEKIKKKIFSLRRRALKPVFKIQAILSFIKPPQLLPFPTSVETRQSNQKKLISQLFFSDLI